MTSFSHPAQALTALTCFVLHHNADTASLIFFNEVDEEASIFCLLLAPSLIHSRCWQNLHGLVAGGTAFPTQQPCAKGFALCTIPANMQSKSIIILCLVHSRSSAGSFLPTLSFLLWRASSWNHFGT